MAEGKESIPSVTAVSQLSVARGDKWPRHIFNMLISSYNMTTLLIEGVGEINQLFSSDITLQIPVVLLLRVWGSTAAICAHDVF